MDRTTWAELLADHEHLHAITGAATREPAAPKPLSHDLFLQLVASLKHPHQGPILRALLVELLAADVAGIALAVVEEVSH
jgi:hypothetical protein